MERREEDNVEKKRIRDFGIVPGRLETGKRNKITDVPGVKVGHCTIKTEENHKKAKGCFGKFLDRMGKNRVR